VRTLLFFLTPETLTRLLVILAFSLPLPVHAAGSSDDSDETDSTDLSVVERLIYKEKYSLAIKRLKQIVKSDKQNADAWNLLGYASRKSGDLQAAGNAYDKALSIDSNHLGSLEYQGELFITMGKLDEATNNLNRLNILCPDGCEEQQELADALAALN